jgi:hypothetical protein
MLGEGKVVGTLGVPVGDCVIERTREGSVVEVESNRNPVVALSMLGRLFLPSPSLEDSDLRVLGKVGMPGVPGGEEEFLDEELARMSLFDILGSDGDGGAEGLEFLRNRAGFG